MNRIKQAVAGNDDGSADSLDEATLRQTLVERILALRQRGPMGVDQLPQVVEVTISVSDDRSVDVVRGYVDDPGFDDEVGAALANRLVGVGANIPLRLYTVERAGKTSIAVHEADGGAWAQMRIEGGDRDGVRVAIAGDRPRYHLGRGDWHGDGEAPANDIIVSDGDRFISRRAGVLRRAGSGLEITSLDQGEFLVVIRPNDQRLRPTHARSGRIRLAIGDRIELTDGRRQRIVLHLERRTPTRDVPASDVPAVDRPDADVPDADRPAPDEPAPSVPKPDATVHEEPPPVAADVTTPDADSAPQKTDPASSEVDVDE